MHEEEVPALEVHEGTIGEEVIQPVPLEQIKLPEEESELAQGEEEAGAPLAPRPDAIPPPTQELSDDVQIVGEFQDSALLKAFGQAGAGVFAVPSVIENEVRRQYNALSIGTADEIVENFYAISVERSIKHPAVAAICDSARAALFA